MSFIVARFTTTAAVIQNGTFTIPYPMGTNIGSFVGARAHLAFVEGQAAFVSTNLSTAMNPSGQNVIAAPGFSLTAQASNILITWLNVTPIPANTSILFQLDQQGLDRPGPYDLPVPLFDAARAFTMYVRLGAPATASATAIVNVTAVLNANVTTLATPFQIDVPRVLAYVSANVGDTTQTMTIKGTDRYGVVMTETVTMNGTTAVAGKKAFFTVVSYKASAALAGVFSLGTGNTLGFPILLERRRHAIAESLNDVAAANGTFLVGDVTPPSATTGDIRGTYLPSTVPNGTNVYELFVAAPDPTGLMLQF